MVNLDNLLYDGSIMIYMDKEGNVVGTALIRDKNGYIPFVLSSEELRFVYEYKNIVSKLKNGNRIYSIDGNMYIGYPESREPYAEEKLFVSFADANSLSLVEMLINIENKLSKNNVKRLELLKIGEFYKNIRNKD